MDSLLDRIETYYDAVPRADAGAEDLGPFTLFRARLGWPYYARPRRGYVGPTATVADVLAVRERQRELSVPEAFEWVDEVTPGLLAVVSAADLVVVEYPLLVLAEPTPPPALRTGVSVSLVAADDAELLRIDKTIQLGFGSSGTAVGAAGAAERDAAALETEPSGVENLRSRLERDLTVLAVVADATGPLAAGMHQPVGPVSEVVGVATLPSARRRGYGAAVTAALVADARNRGVATVFLSAGSNDVARVYERVGFRRVGTACIAATA